jgi:HPt (histidine-containing phosphotransfer) domain-containing protein
MVEGTLTPQVHIAEAAPRHASPGDSQALARIRMWGGERLVRDLTELFLAQVPQRVAAAREGIRTGNAAEVERAAHSLKSSCGQLGAVAMQGICTRIEGLAAQGALPPIPEMLDELESEFARYLDWLSTATQGAETRE